MKKEIMLLLVLTLYLSGCASYRAGRLPTKDVFSYDNRQEQNGLFIAVKFFEPYEIRKIFQRNMQDNGVDPIFVVIDNRSKNTYQFAKSMVNKNVFDAEEVAKMCGFSTVGRATSYGVAGLFIWPLLIPAVVDGVGSSQANTRMRDDYAYKEIKDERITPNGLLNGILFIERMKSGEEISIRLQNINTQETALFSFKKP
jgi:hypothetical protein